MSRNKLVYTKTFSIIKKSKGYELVVIYMFYTLKNIVT